MNSYGLKPEEYEKIIHFSAQIAYPVEDTRLHIQRKLADMFGYDQTIFWYADDHGNLTDPINYKVSDKALTEYLTKYHHYDLLHPSKNVRLFREKKAIRLDDLVPPMETEKLPFHSYLKEHGYHDEMVVALIHQEKIVGVIGMAQKKDLYKFTQKDSYKLQLLSDVIASVILHQAKDKGCLLSNREMDVVELVKKGMINQAIANSLHISVNTVKKHLQNIYEKYNVQNRTQLVQRI